MSEKKIKDVKVEAEATKEKESWKYGTSPLLAINMVRDNRVFKFDMPIGAHLDECASACIECGKIIQMMKEEGERKIAEEAKKKSESVDEEKNDSVKKEQTSVDEK